VNVTTTVFGSEALQGDPPPVHADDGSVTTVVADDVLAVVLEQAVPSPADPHVYVKSPEATDGPPV
jgi:hypothetical protein